MPKSLPTKRKRDRAYDSAPRSAVNELRAQRKEFNRVSTDFLKIDVETALTFAGLALQTDDARKKHRNQNAARTAYDTIRRLMKNLDLGNEDAQMLSSGLALLKSKLQILGELF